jgi:glycosyltransferase involved in cell wall biosynthesis
MTVTKDTTSQAPSVTIGMPVYNGEKYLRESLESLLQQTFTDFELVISDNASTDGTEALCREFAARDSRIRYVRHVQTSNAQANFNFVLKEARGQYFMWAASDDLWSSRYIEALRETLENDPNCVTAQGEQQVIDGEGIPMSEVKSFHELENPSRLARLYHIARGRTTNLFFYALHRREVLMRHPVKPFHIIPKLANNSETRLLFYLVSAGTVKTNRAARFLYRSHSSSYSGKGVPILGSVLVRSELILMTAVSTWQGSRSAFATLFTFLISAFFQTRAIVWLLIRVMLGKVPRISGNPTA